MSIQTHLRKRIIDVPDFPKPGIVFRDITPVFLDSQLCRAMVIDMAGQFSRLKLDAIIGLESRGFLLGMPLAIAMDLPFVLARKKGKLPRSTYEVTYALEYGEATIEMHRDAIQPGWNVLVHDDVLATGGTASAAASLVKAAGARVAAFSFLLELKQLGGRKYLDQHQAPVFTFATS
ncbi:MAG: adenine phosphoribosyltransferase [Flavobacteriales bacterium]|nr:adenine phosphoribosyltransferase [Flavobacteriales bacterium]